MTVFKGCFIIQQVFLKNPFVGGHDRFEGKGASGDKNQYNLFCRHPGFEYFSFKIFFSKKKQYFIKYRRKIIFGGHDHFWGNRSSEDKNEYNLFLENGVPNAVFKFFLQKPITIWLKPEKLILEAHFPPYSVVLLGWLFFKNNRCELDENRFKTATCIVRSYTYMWCAEGEGYLRWKT